MTPTELAVKYVNMNRGTGRTAALIESLPDEKCAVITMSTASSSEIKRRIAEQRPDYNIDNVQFATYRPGSGWRDVLIGRYLPVYFDNDVLDDVMVRHVKAINELYGKNLVSL